MKRIDLSKPGGFPFTQDALDYLQQAYTESINVLASLPVSGSAPVILSGMAVSGGGNTVANGWFIYGGEMIKFTGGTVTPGGGEVAIVEIQTSPASVTFNDGSTPAVMIETIAVLTHRAPITDATHFPVSALVPYLEALAGRNSGFTSVGVSTGGGQGSVTGTIYYRKDFTSNTVTFYGVLTATNPGDFIATPNALDILMATLPVGYRPTLPLNFFTAYVPGAYVLRDDGAKIATLKGSVSTAGEIFIRWDKPDAGVSSYSIEFNATILLG